MKMISRKQPNGKRYNVNTQMTFVILYGQMSDHVMKFRFIEEANYKTLTNRERT